MAAPFRLLREALWHLSLEPDEQRRELDGTVVTDELALDLGNAVESLEYAQETAGIRLADDLVAEVQRLSALLDAPPGDAFWEDESLDDDPRWAEARRLAGELLPLVDDDTPSPCPVCGAGPEQSSDPENMSRSVCYCGHPRFYDYKVRPKPEAEQRNPDRS